ncbi:predicted protein [Naegleria gruberi]|uniref:Predicted protein n=1 Tax=Naegleria gruberi TaxID=5762 RepID=D2VW57_NAEGR|nr:uncharacterized protein NAEGRDRAFT_73258 [Naegleria gruberi]EFC39018.1 predicted protein [Naegleria gruberi]|eukprot:XP_002671762.1 predicted protein [Naegleria gruberi strain NEG-M]
MSLSMRALPIILFLMFYWKAIHCQTSTIPNQLVSIEFNQMINAAMKQVSSSKSFINYIANTVAFSVPACTSNPSWPTKFPIPSSVKELKLCYDGVTSDTMWADIYKRVGLELVSAINSKYGTSLATRFVYVNATDGFFESMKKAVETEECDVSVADSTYTTERRSKVQFSDCGYGSTANGFLRTLLNKENNATFANLKDISQLNSPDIIVAAYFGTYYETLANQTLPLAKKIFTSFDEQFELIKNNKVHVVISDSEALQSWKVTNCPSCIGRFEKLFYF